MCGDFDVVARAIDLIRSRHHRVKLVPGEVHQPRVGDPSAVVPVGRFAVFVGANFGQRLFVCVGIVLDRDLSGHPANRRSSPMMTGLDRQQRIRPQEMRGHRHLGPIGQHHVRSVAEAFDETEDVVPASAIQAGRMLPQFVQNLVHLERGQDRFDQHRGTNCPGGNAQVVLRLQKDVVPQPCFEMTFQLGQIEIGPASLVDQPLGIVVEEQAEVEQGCGNEPTVDAEMTLFEVPAAGTHDERRYLLIEAVVLTRLRLKIVDGACYRVAKIDLAVERACPSRRMGVLEVGHKAVGPGVQRVDDHFAVDRSSDFHSAVAQIGRQRCDVPVLCANILRTAQEIRQSPRVEQFLSITPLSEQDVPACIELTLQTSNKLQCIDGENGGVCGRHRPQDFDAVKGPTNTTCSQNRGRHGSKPLSCRIGCSQHRRGEKFAAKRRLWQSMFCSLALFQAFAKLININRDY